MSRKLRKVVCMLAFLLVSVMAVSVDSEAAAKLSKSSAKLFVGETLQLKVTGGSGAVTYSTNSKKVATVSKKGLVTAKKAGKCVITAKQGGRKLSCKVEVTALPSDYATVNGKRVKVGDTVKLIYKLKSKKPICQISVKYRYNKKGLQVVSEESDRFKVWVCNESIEDFLDKGKPCDLYHLCGIDPANPYDMAEISCSKGKVVDSMSMKVLKSGNYTVKAEYYGATKKGGIDVKGYKITTTVK